MFFFMSPASHVPYHRSPITCATKKLPARKFRARSRASRTPSTPLPDLPEAFLRSLNRLIRTHSFILRVAESLNWPYIRYTGTILPLPPPESGTVDAIPQPTYPFHSITLPQGLLKQACEASESPEQLSQQRLCAIFETYGEGDERVEETLAEMENFENDIRNQLLAWSDRGQCMRTETDLTDLNGPELMHERYLDYLD